MIKKSATRKTIAIFFLCLLFTETLAPMRVWALTSGPAQPESQQFAVAGTSDMVDLFTGDFKYNIPLLDVDGYPVNLNYASGVGMEDEASWVGLGWNLNVGAVNRQLRGIADDASGDVVETENYMKPKITVGGRITGRVEIGGWDNFIPVNFNGSGSISIFSDNYTGYGADVGVGTGASFGLSVSGSQTAGLSLGAGLSLNSSTQDGVTLSPNISFSVKKDGVDRSSTSAGLSANLGYNTREGLKSTTLGTSFSFAGTDDKKRSGSAAYSTAHSYTNYNTPAFYPKTVTAFRTKSQSYGFDIGGSATLLYWGAGVTGYKTTREVLNRITKNSAFGFMYAERAKQKKDALMDFMREKDNPVIPSLPNLAIPIAAPDMFSYSGQAGGGQFRLYRGSAGTFSDASVADRSSIGSISAEYGFGAYFHGGATFTEQDVRNRTGKWKERNDFLVKGDYPAPATVEEETAYFKMIGEKNGDDRFFPEAVLETAPARVALSGKRLSDQLTYNNNGYDNEWEGNLLKREGRQSRRTPILALTAEEAVDGGLDKHIRSYPFNDISVFPTDVSNIPQQQVPEDLPRVSADRKPHHISEFTIQSDNGSRMVYGLPVYNLVQKEYTFSVDPEINPPVNNLIPYNYDPTTKKIQHTHAKTDHYYRMEKQPAYATAHLLTGVLSPDYVDLTGDGISDDDPGTAVKFNYSKVTGSYKWRSPYGNDDSKSFAQYNKGLYADLSDDKGNIIYGEKELWYLHSIESKTKIAYFITENRNDAIGVKDEHGKKEPAVRQKRLREIRLYSKTDMTRPIKTVVFKYDDDAELCIGIPNVAVTGRGKLKLERVYFKYNNSEKGQHHPYRFEYGLNTPYALLATDRWGAYKKADDNAALGFPDMRNDEFPYAMQGAEADNNAASWHLSNIKLPSGGEINVQYESDDYSWVQGRRAMKMIKIEGLIDNGRNITSSLKEATGFRIQLPHSLPEGLSGTGLTNWFIRNYLSGKPYLYAKLFVNVSDQPASDDEQYYDYVPCYGEVAEVDPAQGNLLNIMFKQATVGRVEANPFILAAWQKMRLEYPRYAYPGYKNRIDDDRPVAAAVSALGNAISNFGELKRNFNERAKAKGFASKVKLNKSYARLGCYQSDKDGGGVRVKQIRISDMWDNMAEGGSRATYGQAYDYTMSEDGAIVSSGVASYEPAIGGDENPMRMPVPYSQEFHWALTNSFYLEEPMGESLFPAPQVGYRKVTVRNLDASGSTSDRMGYTVSEFYTAKEFPVKVGQTNAEKVESETKRWYPFFGGDYAHEVYMSQGYLVHLNDMHGKPFRESVMNQKGEVISSMEYRYNTSDESGNNGYLSGRVPVAWNYEKPNAQWVGREAELFTDLREQETASTNLIYNVGVDVIPFLGIPFPFPHIPLGQNNDYKLFRSASVLKTIQDYGILVETIKTVNGSSITTTYELFDVETGDPVVTRTQNEFEDPVYAMNIPAYWAHEGMGPAYKTLGMVIPDFATEEDGSIKGPIKDVLKPGDELIDNDQNRSWVVLSSNQTNPETKLLIDAVGRIRKEYSAKVKVIRSGYRNMLTATSATFVTLTKPDRYLYDFFSGYHTDEYPMLEAKATLYHEAWGRPADCNLNSCPEGYNESPDGTRCVLYADRVDDPELNILPGFNMESYGSDKTDFIDENLVTHHLTTGYWGSGMSHSRLNKCGIWLSNNQTGVWWGVEACFEVPVTGDYYFGVGSDNRGIYYIDDIEVANHDYLADWTSDKWHVYAVHLEAGSHNVRINALNEEGGFDNPRAVGMEVYAASHSLMLSGSQSINDTRVFSTEWLRGDNLASTFKLTAPNGTRTAARYVCPSGKTLSEPCNGTPNCGYKEKGDCPDGYNKSPDGQSCIPIITTNNSPDLSIQKAPYDIVYDQLGGYLFDDISPSGQKLDTSFFSGGVRRICNPEAFASAFGKQENISALALGPTYCGRLNANGIRLAGNYSGVSVITGVTGCFDAPATKTYYIGFSANRYVKVYIDDVLFKSRSELNGREKWHVYPLELTAGNHTIRIEAQALSTGEIPVMGLEIYNGERAQLLDAWNLGILWSTASLQNNSYNSFVRSAGTQAITAAKTLCGGELQNACTGCEAIPNGGVLNPYLTGYLGNWVTWKDFVYLDSRNDNGVFAPNGTGLNIRKSGTYIVKTPFYYMQSYGGLDQLPHDGSIPGWVVAREATMQDRNMQELENKDALGRYSSARYGFRGVLPTAVASNARHREIYYDGFEDYKFYNHVMAKPTCDVGEFDIRKALGGDYVTRLETERAHTGRYSLRLNGSPLALKTWQFNEEHTPGIYLSNNLNGEFYRNVAPWLGLWGFAPMNAKEYVFSSWVKDSYPLTDDVSITIALNGAPVELIRKATVGGWKLVEGKLMMPAGSPPQLTPVTLAINGSNGILIDDIRIFPFDAQIKTYSYDDRTLRVMGEMDENNFATYYEYDDEGSLIRVKKETERGIITIKESKTSYKKQNP